MTENIKLIDLLHALKRTGVRLAAVAEAAGINKATIYSISAGRGTSRVTERYLRQVIAANYPEQLKHINELAEMGVIK